MKLQPYALVCAAATVMNDLIAPYPVGQTQAGARIGR